jgi:hypothetical protein
MDTIFKCKSLSFTFFDEMSLNILANQTCNIIGKKNSRKPSGSGLILNSSTNILEPLNIYYTQI